MRIVSKANCVSWVIWKGKLWFKELCIEFKMYTENLSLETFSKYYNEIWVMMYQQIPDFLKQKRQRFRCQNDNWMRFQWKVWVVKLVVVDRHRYLSMYLLCFRGNQKYRKKFGCCMLLIVQLFHLLACLLLASICKSISFFWVSGILWFWMYTGIRSPTRPPHTNITGIVYYELLSTAETVNTQRYCQ